MTTTMNWTPELSGNSRISLERSNPLAANPLRLLPVSHAPPKLGAVVKGVKLSQTQVAIAKKLGVPLEEYAKYVRSKKMSTEKKGFEGINRSSRETASREKQGRRKPWTPPSMLDAPPAPEGYKHRWIRAEVRGFDDTRNISARLREGYELVRQDEYPDFEVPRSN